MNPQHGLIGDATGTELPQAEPDMLALNELKKKAKYSRSKEFQELKANMETRIEFYQKYLPDGTPIAALDAEKAAKHWPVANLVIAELKQVIDMYESAQIQLEEYNAEVLSPAE